MSNDSAERVKKIVVEYLGVDETKVMGNSSFMDDLGADGLDAIEPVMAFEDEFDGEIPDSVKRGLTIVGARLDQQADSDRMD